MTKSESTTEFSEKHDDDKDQDETRSTDTSVGGSGKGDDKIYSTGSWYFKVQWLLFELSSHFGIIAGAGFWIEVALVGIQRGFSVNYLNVAAHGPLTVLVAIDGFLVHAFDVRWCHWSGFIVPAELGYITWTLLHFVFVAKNPDTGVTDNIYEHLDWQGDPGSTLIDMILLVLPIGALCFALLRWVSRRRRHRATLPQAQQEEHTDDVSEQCFSV